MFACLFWFVLFCVCGGGGVLFCLFVLLVSVWFLPRSLKSSSAMSRKQYHSILKMKVTDMTEQHVLSSAYSKNIFIFIFKI